MIDDRVERSIDGAVVQLAWVDALHVFALSSFAVAWPLFDALSRSGLYFAAHGMTAAGVVAFAVGLVLVPPIALTAVVLLTRMISAPAARYVQAFVVGGLAAIAVLVPLPGQTGDVSRWVNLLYPAVALVAALIYLRARVARRFVTFLTPAPVVFLALFLVFGPISAYVRGPGRRLQPPSRPNGTSVVHIVFDELALAALLEPDGSIDAKRFPNFARLAKRSTWYPNATTNANLTSKAFPILVTGRYPRGAEEPPIAHRFPNNIFSLVSSTHRQQVDEWVTGICAADACGRARREQVGTRQLIGDTAVVYAGVAAPPAVARRLPTPGFQVVRLLADPWSADERIRGFPSVLRPFVAPFFRAFVDRDPEPYELRRFSAFMETVEESVTPTYWFHHSGLPHMPGRLLPDGRAYDDTRTRGAGVRIPWPDVGSADEALQRWMMQLRATDRLVGELIDRLDDEELWDETLVIVQSDHGITFKKGRGFRSVIQAEKDVLPIPLFVKYPGQRKGRIDGRNAELIDIAPTIADVLGTSVPWDVDGRSLRMNDPPARAKRAWVFANELEYGERLEGTSPLRERVYELFGRYDGSDDLFAWGPHRKFVGDRVSSFDVTPTPRVRVAIERPERYADVAADSPLMPARVSGSFTPTPKRPWAWVAVAANGRIAGLGRPFKDGARWRFSVMLSPRFLADGRNAIEMYGVAGDGELVAFGRA